ncbi:DUF1642 domain-containing protein [Enterococcus hailinensis]|uniref:DUF1642 domain-containing protein n=1 Tax=Enterococcus hailinensis TaxID=3238988 RepID=UPI0038B2FA9C
MNKKEFIEKLKGHGAWCTECHDINGEKDRYVKVAKVRELLEQLDEPQKVKVPAAIDQYIRKRKSDGDNFHESILATSSLIYEWYMENAELYEQAWVNGYEVEEESKWIVCYSTMYLKSPIETGQIESV